MANNIEDLQKVIDNIIRDVNEVKKEVQSIISGQNLGSYKSEIIVKALEKIEAKVINIQDEVSTFKDELKSEINSTKEDIRKESYRNFVTKDQYAPVKNVVMTLVGLILVAVVSALLAIVIITPVP